MENTLVCEQCHSTKHVKMDCPAYKITSKFENNGLSCGYNYKHYGVPLYDTHCHLDYVFDRFKHDNLSFQKFMQKENFPDNFKGCITSFSDPAAFSSFGISSDLLTQDGIWGTFGIHPHHAKSFNQRIEDNIIKFLQHPKAVAVGECGLDYSFRCPSPIPVQKRVLLRHIKIAKEFMKPLVLHSREAEDDVFELLCLEGMKNWPIHVHCFTGCHSQLHRFINEFENMYFGFTNLVSYSTATTTHEVAKSIPLDRVLLETDAPYFVPRSLRDREQFSHPGNVLFVAEEIASIKNIDVDTVLEHCRRNVRKLYKI